MPVELAEVAKRRAGIVVDENIRLGTGFEQRLLPVGGRDVGRDRDNFGAGSVAEFGRGSGKPFAIAAIDDDLAAGFSQRFGAGAAEAAARSADDRFAAGDAEIHG